MTIYSPAASGPGVRSSVHRAVGFAFTQSIAQPIPQDRAQQGVPRQSQTFQGEEQELASEGLIPALIRNGTKADAAAADTTINPAYPASVVAGELLLLIQSKADSLASLTGWTPVDDAFDDIDAVVQVWSRIADGTETGTLSVPNGTRSSAQIIAVPGGSTNITTSKAVTPGTAAASLTLPAITAVSGSVLIYVVAGGIAPETFTGDSVTHTEIEDFGSGGRTGAIYRDNAVDGSGTRTVTPTASRRMAALLLRVAPTLSPSPPTVALNTLSGSTTDATPVLEMTGSDANQDRLRYNVQISADAAFTAPLNKTSGTHGGFASQDTFDDNVFSTSKWIRDNSTQIVEVNQQLEMSTILAGNYIRLSSNHYYDLTGISASLRLVNAGNQELVGLETYPLILQKDTTNSLQFRLDGGSLRAEKYVAGTTTQVGTAETYSQSTHQYLRIRESVGTTYWETSSNRVTWTTLASQANPISVTSLRVDIVVGTFQAETTTTTLKFDDVQFGRSDLYGSGDQVGFTVLAADALAAGTWYWRARAIDPAGSNTWSAFTASRTFTVSGASSAPAALSGAGSLATGATPKLARIAALSGSGILNASGTATSSGITGTATLSGSGGLSVSSRNLFNPALITTSFENSTTTGWANRSNVASLASVVGNASHGTRSMQVTGSAAGTVQIITTDFHPCTVGLYYALSFHATSTLTFQMWIDWYDSSDTYITTNGIGLGAPVGGASRFKWEAILPPAGATQFKMFIEALSVPANGTFHVDAFQYEQAYYATPYDAGIGTPGLTPTVALSGSGTLTAATTPRPVRTAALSGSGSLSTTRTPDTSASVALSGDGSLTASGAAATTSFAGAATLSGSGTLALTNNINLFNPSLISTSFENSTTTGWAGRTNVASLASVAGNAGHGTRSMQVTATASGGTVGIITSGFHPATAGLSYHFGLYAATTLSFQIWVDWYDSAGTYLSTTGSGLGAPAGGAARLGNWFNAPASATQFKVYFEAVSVPANGTFHVDAFQYEQATSGTAYAPGDAGTPSFSAAAAFSGSGTLSATATPRPTRTASFSGSGTLSAAAATTPTQAVSFSGSGTLSATQVPRPAWTVALSGAGTLSATRTPDISVSVPLSGSGTLTASGVATTTGVAGTATLSGSGTLSTTQVPRPVRIATLSGSGLLITSSVISTVALSGSGTLITSSVIPDVASDADWILTAILNDGGIANYPDKAYMVPYFAHLAAMGLARATEVTGNQSYATASWNWLDWYAAHQDANGFVTDYNIAPTTQALTSTGDMDSTDSYAALFFLAAHKTWKVTGNTTRLTALTTGLNGAMTAIEATLQPDGLTWAKPAYHVKYLMDNVEVYAGVQAAYAIGRVLGNTTLQSRALTASKAVVAGVETLWNPSTQAYDWAKFENGDRSVTNWSVGYPDAHAQAFAVAFGLVRGTRATDLVNRFDLEQPLWDQPAATHNGVVVSYWPPSGWAFIQVGKTARSQLGARRIRSAAIAVNRAWPHHTGVAGGLIVLESTDLSYLAPVVDKSTLSGSGTLNTGSSPLPSLASFSGSGTLSVSRRNLFSPAAITTSFEDGSTLGWAGYANTSSLTSVVGNASHGTRSMRVTAGAGGGTVGIDSGSHPCTAGLPYSFSFHATTTLNMQGFVQWLDSAGTVLSTPGVGLGAPAGGAQRFNIDGFTAPASATQVKLFVEVLSLPANGTCHVDAFQYEQASVATAYTESVGDAGKPGPQVIRALSGSGSLSTTTTPRPARTAALSGTGTLSVAGSTVFAGISLSGLGTLATAQAMRVLRTAIFTGAGTLSTPGSSLGPLVIRFGSTTYIMRVGSSQVYLRAGP